MNMAKLTLAERRAEATRIIREGTIGNVQATLKVETDDGIESVKVQGTSRNLAHLVGEADKAEKLDATCNTGLKIKEDGAAGTIKASVKGKSFGDAFRVMVSERVARAQAALDQELAAKADGTA